MNILAAGISNEVSTAIIVGILGVLGSVISAIVLRGQKSNKAAVAEVHFLVNSHLDLLKTQMIALENTITRLEGEASVLTSAKRVVPTKTRAVKPDA
jgi:hypothetical protein